MLEPHAPQRTAAPRRSATTPPQAGLAPPYGQPPPAAGEIEMALLAWRAGPQLAAVVDSEGRLASANPAWQRLLGWAPGALRGRLLLSLVHPDEQGAAQRWLQRVLDGAGPASFTGRWRRVDGQFLQLHWTLALRDGLVCAGGQPLPAATTSTPAPEQPAVAAESLRARQQTLRGLARLSGGLSHELNNLLQVLRNTLELIHQRPGEPRQVAGWATSALRIVERSSELTTQLLAFAGHQRLTPRTLPVAALLQQLRGRIDELLGPRITLQLQLPAEGGLATCDPAQLEHAVLGLVRNAVEAMPQGGRLAITLGRAHVEEDAELSTGEYVTIDVTDTGAGMSNAVRERAFEPFFTTRALGRGRGLGLSAIYGSVQQVGGAVRLLPGGPGHRVRLLLPAALPPPPRPVAAGAAAADGPDPQPRVLVVVDDADRRQLLLSALNLLGYTRVQAVNAVSAQALIERDAPDVVVLGLPARPVGPDELARRARRQRPGVGVVRLDALATAPHVPLDMDALAQAIARATAPHPP